MFQNDWELLIALFEEKNITKTAHRLFLSQPGLTKRLKNLENEFEVEIVIRTPKGVIFTPEGISLVEYSKDMLKSYNDIKEKLSLIKYSKEKNIKIGVPNGFARKFLPKLLAKFQEIYPIINFEIVTGWSSDIFNLLSNNEIDAAFIRGEHHWNKEVSTLFEEYIYLINSTEIDINNLSNKTRIDYESDVQFNSLLNKWWKDHFNNPPKKKMKVDRSDICIKMVIQGLGYSIVPSLIIDANDKIFKLKIFDKNGVPLKRKTQLFYSEEFSKLTVGKNFINLVKKIDFSNF